MYRKPFQSFCSLFRPRGFGALVQRRLFASSAKKSKTLRFAASLFLVSCVAAAGFRHQFLRSPEEMQNAAVLAEEIGATQGNGRELPHFMRNLEHSEPPVYRIVLTGGPCAGKSSAMTLLSERLRSLGFQVFLVTEVATMIMTGGAKIYDNMDIAERFAFESGIMRTQMALEDVYLEIAKASGKPTILLCDRGVMDTKAYMDPQAYESMIEANNWNIGKMRDSRYDCIIHMVTAAIGAEQFYTKANNATRSEDLSLARTIDVRLRESYIGHSNLFFVDNSTDFDGKIKRVLNIVLRMVGAPKPIGTKRRFLINGTISNSSLTQAGVPFTETEIEQIFLDNSNPHEQSQLRKLKAKDGGTNYQVSTKVFSDDGKESLILRRITGRTYMSLQTHKKNDMDSIKRYVRSFVFQDHYFEIVTYLLHSNSYSDNRNITIIRVEAPAEKDIEFPQFLKDLVLGDVTFNDRYSSYSLARNAQKKQ